MAAKKKAVRRARAPQTTMQGAAKRLARTWDDTKDALGSAESRLETQVRGLLRKSGVDAKKAMEAVEVWRERVQKERRRAMKQLEARMLMLQSRAKKERRAVTRMVDETVQGALAALNIPSRQEVHELTKRVEELSKKIDGFRRSAARPAAPRANA
jgi:hypothetical protein